MSQIISHKKKTLFGRIQHWVKSFASKEGRKYHGVKVTLYTVTVNRVSVNNGYLVINQVTEQCFYEKILHVGH